MEFSRKQENAIESVIRWVKNGSPGQVFRLFGYAGTGKTTLAKKIAQEIDGFCPFVAYTGKAGQVLREKGCFPVSTIHRMIYIPGRNDPSKLINAQNELLEYTNKLSENGFTETRIERDEYVIELKKTIEIENKNYGRPNFLINTESEIRAAKLVILDEASMIDTFIGEDLLSFGIPILVMGDPAQLPPVHGSGFFMKKKPDILLTEIHRQAENSGILRLATKVRMKEPIEIGQYEDDCSVIHLSNLTSKMALGVDQIIVGRNQTRHAYNKRVRQLLGHYDKSPVIPVPGERVICLKNNHENGLLNGSQWEVIQAEGRDDLIWMLVQDAFGYQVETLTIPNHFAGKSKDLKWFETADYDTFDFGYTITVHKSQGSQWGKVLLVDEGRTFKADEFNWRYTGITRASESLIVAVGN